MEGQEGEEDWEGEKSVGPIRQGCDRIFTEKRCREKQRAKARRDLKEFSYPKIKKKIILKAF